jgi:hypothetical protein
MGLSSGCAPGFARAGGRIAVGLSVLLLFVVALGSGLNVLNLWTIALCWAAGLLAIHGRLGVASVVLLVGALPALLGGVGFLYLPCLLLFGLSALCPNEPAALN